VDLVPDGPPEERKGGPAVSHAELGALLRAAREKKGLTLRDVQAELKIRQQYLRALEEGAWEEIPGETYARGFARSYGRFLGIDVDALLAPAPEPRPVPTEAPKSGGRATRRRGRPMARRTRLRRPARLLWLIVPLVLLVLLVLVLAGRPAHTSVPVAKGGATHARTTGHGRQETARTREERVRGYRVVSVNGVYVTLAAARPVPVTIALRGVCWLSAVVDGVQYPGTLYHGGAELRLEVRQSASFVIGLPANAVIDVAHERYPTAGATPLHLIINAES
jgi:transcriptional regulator with XRE-family HTH domain